ncbi:hypothetical protein SYNPS1DRAFT_23600 [Syncephalis pseudoplumigaleata]|uniref:Uncharacterized protein n=1 Tax=Syncephalis pseudoplumigaleata TaxID=1712513 RepID=A0A4V1J198_9FUNG|nr:hypothetical protein SYNPS1DRAFT_23600 [Syncephalis pseudoplumigaleata]|eukprot:RKP24309.1 hypothetical protein SYNPS1DRAFT_23600 [Syncephalis pseudoplumigaleata]
MGILLTASVITANIAVIDLDYTTKYADIVDGAWDIACFCEADDEAAVVYTARLAEEDGGHRLEWALHCSPSDDGTPTKQLRAGWLHLPEVHGSPVEEAYGMHGSLVAVRLRETDRSTSFLVHSIASSGQGATPQHAFTIEDSGLPTALAKQGLQCPLNLRSLIRCGDPFDEGQFMRLPGMNKYEHVIGSLYAVTVGRRTHESVYLVDIDTRRIVRVLKRPDEPESARCFLMTGAIIHQTNGYQSQALTLQAYGAL